MKREKKPGAGLRRPAPVSCSSTKSINGSGENETQVALRRYLAEATRDVFPRDEFALALAREILLGHITTIPSTVDELIDSFVNTIIEHDIDCALSQDFVTDHIVAFWVAFEKWRAS